MYTSIIHLSTNCQMPNIQLQVFFSKGGNKFKLPMILITFVVVIPYALYVKNISGCLG